jgi:DnaJ-class molecular chaperone
MKTLIICERCDGTGADPEQDSTEVRACVECGGDGCHITYFAEFQQTA